MNLAEGLAYRKLMISQRKRSDGCTSAPDFNFRECCEMHDFLRRYNKIPASDADLLLRECIESKGHKILAFIYYWMVVIARKLGFFN